MYIAIFIITFYDIQHNFVGEETQWYHSSCGISLLLILVLSFTPDLCANKDIHSYYDVTVIYAYIINLKMFTNCLVYPDSANHYLMNEKGLTADGPLKEMFLFQVTIS